MAGKFISVGLGPGDSELLTIKAIKAIKNSDIIGVPVSGASKNIALEIAEEYLEGKEILYLDMPMTRDKEILDKSHEEATKIIKELLDKEKTIAFLTLGDPCIYSTSMYVHKRIKESGYDTLIVPGITSFSAAGAALDMSLCEGEQGLHIIPGSYGDLEETMSLSGTKIFMKSGKSSEAVIKIIRESESHKGMIVECASMKNEKIYENLEAGKINSYFSLIIAKEER